MTDDEMIEIVAKMHKIENICRNYANCDCCPFWIGDINGYCIFDNTLPYEWKLKELMNNIIKGGKE